MENTQAILGLIESGLVNVEGLKAELRECKWSHYQTLADYDAETETGHYIECATVYGITGFRAVCVVDGEEDFTHEIYFTSLQARVCVDENLNAE